MRSLNKKETNAISGGLLKAPTVPPKGSQEDWEDGVANFIEGAYDGVVDGVGYIMYRVASAWKSIF